MRVHDELFNIVAVVMNNPNEHALRRAVDEISGVCEREYVKGAETQKKLLRIRLGLAVESD